MNDFLVAILNGINSVIHNYGWSMVVFTLLIKLILLPVIFLPWILALVVFALLGVEPPQAI